MRFATPSNGGERVELTGAHVDRSCATCMVALVRRHVSGRRLLPTGT
jgi:hypothetical protein